jgi:hypothetical protein
VLTLADAPRDSDEVMRDPAPRSRVTPPVAVTGVILLESVYVWWTAARGYFYQDDFVDFGLVKRLGFDGRMLEQPVFGHFVPGYNVVNYLIASVVPYRWPFIEAADVGLFALSLFLLYRLLTTLFGSTWVAVALVALAGASFSLVPSIVWWASGLQQLVAIPAILAAVLCHVRYLSSGRAHFAVLAGLSFAVGLAFYDGTLGAALFIVLMTLLFWPVRPGIAGLPRAAVAYWPAWLCFGVPIALDLLWRFSHYALYATPPLPHALQAVQFVSLSWTQTFVPLLAGLYAWSLPQHAVRAAVGVVGQVLVVLFVIWTVRRRRIAGRAWIMFAATFVFMSSLVGLTRVSLLGPGDAADVRYVGLNVFFFMISVGFALLPLSARSPSADADAARASSRRYVHARRRGPAWTVAACTALCAVIVGYGALLNWDRSGDLAVQLDFGARNYFSRFAATWPPVGSTSAFLWDTQISPAVMFTGYYPYDTATYTIGRLHPSVPIDVWGGHGYMLQPDGSVSRASAATQATGIVPASGSCVHTGARQGGLLVSLDHPLKQAKRWFGVVSYRSATGAVVGETGAENDVRFPKGSGTLLTSFFPMPLTSVIWIVPPHEQLCVTALKIVLPEPTGSGRTTR